jgi:hypothetical protein
MAWLRSLLIRGGMTRRITFDLDPPMAEALDSVLRQANEAAPLGEEYDHNALARSMLEMLLGDDIATHRRVN